MPNREWLCVLSNAGQDDLLRYGGQKNPYGRGCRTDCLPVPARVAGPSGLVPDHDLLYFLPAVAGDVKST